MKIELDDENKINKLKRQAIGICLLDLGAMQRDTYPDNHDGNWMVPRQLGYYVKWVKGKLGDMVESGNLGNKG